jgi:hypothetical protein
MVFRIGRLHPEVEVVHALGERGGVSVEVAMRWSKDQYDDMLIGFANGIRTGEANVPDALSQDTDCNYMLEGNAVLAAKLEEGWPHVVESTL